MSEPEIIRELDGFRGDACLVRFDSEYFVVSSVNALLTGPETLVFRADADGGITDWCEAAGGRGMSREEAIADLAERAA